MLDFKEENYATVTGDQFKEWLEAGLAGRLSVPKLLDAIYESGVLGRFPALEPIINQFLRANLGEMSTKGIKVSGAKGLYDVYKLMAHNDCEGWRFDKDKALIFDYPILDDGYTACIRQQLTEALASENPGMDFDITKVELRNAGGTGKPFRLKVSSENTDVYNALMALLRSDERNEEYLKAATGRSADALREDAAADPSKFLQLLSSLLTDDRYGAIERVVGDLRKAVINKSNNPEDMGMEFCKRMFTMPFDILAQWADNFDNTISKLAKMARAYEAMSPEDRARVDEEAARAGHSNLSTLMNTARQVDTRTQYAQYNDFIKTYALTLALDGKPELAKAVQTVLNGNPKFYTIKDGKFEIDETKFESAKEFFKEVRKDMMARLMDTENPENKALFEKFKTYFPEQAKEIEDAMAGRGREGHEEDHAPTPEPTPTPTPTPEPTPTPGPTPGPTPTPTPGPTPSPAPGPTPSPAPGPEAGTPTVDELADKAKTAREKADAARAKAEEARRRAEDLKRGATPEEPATPTPAPNPTPAPEKVNQELHGQGVEIDWEFHKPEGKPATYKDPLVDDKGELVLDAEGRTTSIYTEVYLGPNGSRTEIVERPTGTEYTATNEDHSKVAIKKGKDNSKSYSKQGNLENGGKYEITAEQLSDGKQKGTYTETDSAGRSTRKEEYDDIELKNLSNLVLTDYGNSAACVRRFKPGQTMPYLVSIRPGNVADASPFDEVIEKAFARTEPDLTLRGQDYTPVWKDKFDNVPEGASSEEILDENHNIAQVYRDAEGNELLRITTLGDGSKEFSKTVDGKHLKLHLKNSGAQQYTEEGPNKDGKGTYVISATRDPEGKTGVSSYIESNEQNRVTRHETYKDANLSEPSKVTCTDFGKHGKFTRQYYPEDRYGFPVMTLEAGNYPDATSPFDELFEAMVLKPAEKTTDREEPAKGEEDDVARAEAEAQAAEAEAAAAEAEAEAAEQELATAREAAERAAAETETVTPEGSAPAPEEPTPEGTAPEAEAPAPTPAPEGPTPAPEGPAPEAGTPTAPEPTPTPETTTESPSKYGADFDHVRKSYPDHRVELVPITKGEKTGNLFRFIDKNGIGRHRNELVATFFLPDQESKGYGKNWTIYDGGKKVSELVWGDDVNWEKLGVNADLKDIVRSRGTKFDENGNPTDIDYECDGYYVLDQLKNGKVSVRTSKQILCEEPLELDEHPFKIEHFDYDKKGLIAKYVVEEADKETTLEYKNGVPVKETVKEENKTTITDYKDYKNGKKTREFVQEGKGENAITHETLFDKEGTNPVKKTSKNIQEGTDAEGKPITYDEEIIYKDGKPETSVRTYKDGHTVAVTYKDGNPISKLSTYQDHTEQIEYFEGTDKPSSILRTDNKTKATVKDVYDPDNKDRLMQHVETNPNAKGREPAQVTTNYRVDGSENTNTVLANGSSFAIDKVGDKETKRVDRDAKGNVTNAVEYNYDASGNRTEREALEGRLDAATYKKWEAAQAEVAKAVAENRDDKDPIINKDAGTITRFQKDGDKITAVCYLLNEGKAIVTRNNPADGAPAWGIISCDPERGFVSLNLQDHKAPIVFADQISGTGKTPGPGAREKAENWINSFKLAKKLEQGESSVDLTGTRGTLAALANNSLDVRSTAQRFNKSK